MAYQAALGLAMCSADPGGGARVGGTILLTARRLVKVEMAIASGLVATAVVVPVVALVAAGWVALGLALWLLKVAMAAAAAAAAKTSVA